MRATSAFYVVNPISGGGRGLRVWRQVEGELKRRGFPADHALTTGRGSATEIVRQAVIRGHDRIVSVGGDGTIQEVVNGLMDTAGECSAILGIIPGGTGNDFSKLLGSPQGVIEALEVVLNGEVRRLDLGRANGRYFINIAGVGFDAEVAGFLNRKPKSKHIPAGLTYAYGVLVMLFRYRPAEMTLVMDGETISGRCLLVSICNGHTHGGGMIMVPSARPDDGLFDICLAGDLTRLETLVLLPKVFKGAHIGHPKVKLYQTRKISIASCDSLILQADGEVLGGTPAELELTPGVLKVLGVRRAG